MGFGIFNEARVPSEGKQKLDRKKSLVYLIRIFLLSTVSINRETAELYGQNKYPAEKSERPRKGGELSWASMQRQGAYIEDR